MKAVMSTGAEEEECDYCGGSGFITLYDYDGPGLHDEDNCPKCNG